MVLSDQIAVMRENGLEGGIVEEPPSPVDLIDEPRDVEAALAAEIEKVLHGEDRVIGR
jgi:hypothetical protein